jgi:hypothetical protein
MPHPVVPSFRQQRALDEIDRAAIDFDIAIRTHAPDTEVTRQARSMLAKAAAMVKAAVMTHSGDRA